MSITRLHNLSDDHLLTQDQCAEMAGCAASTIAGHRMAGLLPYKITRPITIRAGDFKVYLRMMSNGVKSKLHRSMRIAPEDCPAYSRLDGMSNFTDRSEAVTVATVVKETDALWKKYKAQKKAKERRERAAAA